MTAAGGAVGWEARALARKGHTAGGGRLSQFKTRPHVQGVHVHYSHSNRCTAVQCVSGSPPLPWASAQTRAAAPPRQPLPPQTRARRRTGRASG